MFTVDDVYRRIYDGRPAWYDTANCRHTTDPDLFFRDNRQDIRAAKQVCAACPWRPECLEHALKNRERWGVWGGLTTDERKTIRRLRRITGLSA